MNWNNLIQGFIFIFATLLLVKPLGIYMARIYTGKEAGLNVWFRPVENWTYRLSGIDPKNEQDWKQYSFSLIAFSLVGALFTYAILRLQHVLPLNPQGFGPVGDHLSFNTAMSFITNTNWQSYAGETTLSYFVQMTVLAVQNFVSASAGIAVLLAVIRGLAGKSLV